jgi:pimeloyl-ACP methyl ester carboxylesterase
VFWHFGITHMPSLLWTRIKQPTLSFYSDPSTAPDPQRQKEVAAMMSSFIARIEKSGPQIRVERIPGSHHYMFIDHQDEGREKDETLSWIESDRAE